MLLYISMVAAQDLYYVQRRARYEHGGPSVRAQSTLNLLLSGRYLLGSLQHGQCFSESYS